MKKIIVMLLVLLAFTVSCGEKTTEPPIGGVIDDALGSIEDDQLGGVDELTGYSQKSIGSEAGASSEYAVNIYLNANKTTMKKSSVLKFNGKIDGIDFYNEIVEEMASQYKGSIIPDANLVSKDHFSSETNPPETIVKYKAKGYTLYKMDLTEERYKVSAKLDSTSTGKWETTSKSELYASYYLIKEDGNKIYVISVNSEPTSSGSTSDKYSIDIGDNLDSPNKYITYTKL